MNITIEAKDILLILIGVAGSVIASYIYKFMESSNSAFQAIEAETSSADPAIRARASRRCLFTSAKIFILANIFGIVSGAAWIFGDLHGFAGIVLGGSSVVAILLFALALRWVARAQKGYEI
jgi:hypothetical protein